MIHPIEFYERALMDPDGAPHLEDACVRYASGAQRPLAVRQYLGPADEHDEDILEGLLGPVLDVGCGPGRHLHALEARGVEAYGVDISAVAVRLAREGGATAEVGDIFGELPWDGQFRSALLLDGNIGIGGRPQRLLCRLSDLLAPGGVILVELDPPHRRSRSELARIEAGEETSRWFPWASVSAVDSEDLARACELDVEATWQCGPRWFTRLRRCGG